MHCDSIRHPTSRNLPQLISEGLVVYSRLHLPSKHQSPRQRPPTQPHTLILTAGPVTAAQPSMHHGARPCHHTSSRSCRLQQVTADLVALLPCMIPCIRHSGNHSLLRSPGKPPPRVPRGMPCISSPSTHLGNHGLLMPPGKPPPRMPHEWPPSPLLAGLPHQTLSRDRSKIYQTTLRRAAHGTPCQLPWRGGKPALQMEQPWKPQPGCRRRRPAQTCSETTRTLRTPQVCWASSKGPEGGGSARLAPQGMGQQMSWQPSCPSSPGWMLLQARQPPVPSKGVSASPLLSATFHCHMQRCSMVCHKLSGASVVLDANQRGQCGGKFAFFLWAQQEH